MAEKTEDKRTFLQQFGERAIVAICFGLGGWWLQNQWKASQDLQRALQEYKMFVDEKYVEKDFMNHIDRTHIARFDKIDDKLDKAMNLIRDINTGKTGNHTKIFTGERVSP